MNMAIGGSRGTDGEISPWRMTCERNLGTNGPSSAWPRLNEGHKNGSRVSSFSRQPSRMCSRCAIKSFRCLFVAERIPDHRGASRPSASGSRSRTQLFGQSGQEVDECSTIPDQFTSLKQIGNLTDEARPAQPARRPVPASRRNVARTCGGGAQAPVGPRPALSPADSAARYTRATPAAGINGEAFPFPGLGRIFPGQRGS
jgi:hypothetical protein